MRDAVNTLRPSNSSRKSAEQGFTLIEFAIGLSLMMFGALATLHVTVTSVAVAAENRELSAATVTGRKIVEDLSAARFEEVFARFNADPFDDPDGFGTALGNTFAVVAGDPDPIQSAVNATLTGASRTDPHRAVRRRMRLDVTVEFPVDGAGSLSEAVPPLAAGLPVDLDADGRNAAGTVANYKVLPCLVRLRWQGVEGPTEIAIPRLLMKRGGN